MRFCAKNLRAFQILRFRFCAKNTPNKIRPTKYAQQNTPNKTRSGPRPFSAFFGGFFGLFRPFSAGILKILGPRFLGISAYFCVFLFLGMSASAVIVRNRKCLAEATLGPRSACSALWQRGYNIDFFLVKLCFPDAHYRTRTDNHKDVILSHKRIPISPSAPSAYRQTNFRL